MLGLAKVPGLLLGAVTGGVVSFALSALAGIFLGDWLQSAVTVAVVGASAATLGAVISLRHYPLNEATFLDRAQSDGLLFGMIVGIGGGIYAATSGPHWLCWFIWPLIAAVAGGFGGLVGGPSSIVGQLNYDLRKGNEKKGRDAVWYISQRTDAIERTQSALCDYVMRWQPDQFEWFQTMHALQQDPHPSRVWLLLRILRKHRAAEIRSEAASRLSKCFESGVSLTSKELDTVIFAFEDVLEKDADKKVREETKWALTVARR